MDGGYNDWGLRLYGNSMALNFALSVLRGTGSGAAAVARVAVTPFANPYTFEGRTEAQPLEVGLSYLYDADRPLTEHALALDAEGRLGPLHVQAEYLHGATTIPKPRWLPGRARDSMSLPPLPSPPGPSPRGSSFASTPTANEPRTSPGLGRRRISVASAWARTSLRQRRPR